MAKFRATVTWEYEETDEEVIAYKKELAEDGNFELIEMLLNDPECHASVNMKVEPVNE